MVFGTTYQLVGVRTNVKPTRMAMRSSGMGAYHDSKQTNRTIRGSEVIVCPSIGTRLSRVSEAVIAELVHRADCSRMPWASKATISNIIGAGYGSIAQLANANPEQLYADFFRYGESIGKNLKLGNEIESSYRIAKIVSPLVREAPVS